jgi:hypothetical protein
MKIIHYDSDNRIKLKLDFLPDIHERLFIPLFLILAIPICVLLLLNWVDFDERIYEIIIDVVICLVASPLIASFIMFVYYVCKFILWLIGLSISSLYNYICSKTNPELCAHNTIDAVISIVLFSLNPIMVIVIFYTIFTR